VYRELALTGQNFIFAHTGKDSLKLVKFSKLLRHAITCSVSPGRRVGAPKPRSPHAHERSIRNVRPARWHHHGSTSDWETMTHAAQHSMLRVPHETRVVSAHRHAGALFILCQRSRKARLEVIIAGAGGAAHLPGMTASKTLVLFLESRRIQNAQPSRFSSSPWPNARRHSRRYARHRQAGAINAALLAAASLGNRSKDSRALRNFRSLRKPKTFSPFAILPNPALLYPKARKESASDHRNSRRRASWAICSRSPDTRWTSIFVFSIHRRRLPVGRVASACHC